MKSLAVLLILVGIASAQRLIQDPEPHPPSQREGFGDFAQVRPGDVWRRAAAAVVLIPGEGSRLKGLMGAGFLIAPNRILTANHVLQGRDKVEIYFKNGDKAQAVEGGRWPEADLALLKTASRKEAPIRLATGDVGERVVALGHPFGYQWSLSSGMLTGGNRKVGMPTGVEVSGVWQTDCPINGGNSGGPLLNHRGEAVGIVLAYREGATGIAFALSADRIKELLKQE